MRGTYAHVLRGTPHPPFGHPLPVGEGKRLAKKERHTVNAVVPSQMEVMAGEGRKPGSVLRSGYPPWSDDHSSRTAVADGLKQPDPGASDGPSCSAPLFGLAPDGVYRASGVTAGTGELLPHPFTLTTS